MTLQHRAYIGLGSNINEPLKQVSSAIRMLSQHSAIDLQSRSQLYASKAVGPGEQPDYINAAIFITTSLAPLDLLNVLQDIENKHGRKRTVRWGARTLDLDLLLYDQLRIDEPRLQVPHPRIGERNFVVQPLLDLAPDLQLPDGRQLSDILHIIGTQDLQTLEHSEPRGR
ncbi:MAG: 2-amino-4-hydroxy-6-hydroxymethyldihydropteridine diphosphokinase [Agarilytica sp.]